MSSFLRRVFGGNPPPPPPDPAAKDEHTSAESPVEAKDQSGAIEAPPVDGSILHEELRETVVLCMKDLDETLIEHHRRSVDVAKLLRALRDDPVGGIRELPAAAQRALSMLHGDTPIRALVEVFEKDPALTQALLRAVNKSYYNPTSTRVKSIPDAINRMGRVGMQGVIMEQAMSGMVSRPGGPLDEMASQVWNHMVRSAPLARQLAPAFEASPDEGFLLGLLHDVGKLVIFDRITALRGTQRRLLEIDARVIAQILRHLHEPLGGYALLEWGLEADFARAISTHHREPTPPIRDRMCELTYLAERIDLVRERLGELDLEAMWTEGHLTGDRGRAARALETKSS